MENTAPVNLWSLKILQYLLTEQGHQFWYSNHIITNVIIFCLLSFPVQYKLNTVLLTSCAKLLCTASVHC